MHSISINVAVGETKIPLPAGKKYFGFKVSPSVSLYRYFCGDNPDTAIVSYSNSWGYILNYPWPIGEGDYIIVTATSNATNVTIAFDD